MTEYRGGDRILYREADAEAIVEKIETLVGRLDDPGLEKAQMRPIIYEVASLFEQLIQFRAAMKRAEAAALPRGDGDGVRT